MKIYNINNKERKIMMKNKKEINNELINKVEKIVGEKYKEEIMDLRQNLEDEKLSEDSPKFSNKLYEDFSFVFRRDFPVNEKNMIYFEIWKSVIEYSKTDLNKQEKEILISDIVQNLSMTSESYIKSMGHIVNISSLLIDMFNELNEHGEINLGLDDLGDDQSIYVETIHFMVINLLLGRRRLGDEIEEEEKQILNKGLIKIIEKITEMPEEFSEKNLENVSKDILRDRKIINFEQRFVNQVESYGRRERDRDFLNNFKIINELKSPINKFNINDLSNVFFYEEIKGEKVVHLSCDLNEDILRFKIGDCRAIVNNYVKVVYNQLNEKNFYDKCNPLVSDNFSVLIMPSEGKDLEKTISEQKEILKRIMFHVVDKKIKNERIDSLQVLINDATEDINNWLRGNRLEDKMNETNQSKNSITKRKI